MKRILLIDDDRELCELLEMYFRSQGFAFTAVHDGISGGREALSGNFDAVVLDVMLPERDGFAVLREIRSKSTLPVLMLTAKGDAVDRIVGLEMGADDYIPKPFNTRELEARIRAVWRRTDAPGESGEGEDQSGIRDVGDVTLDLRARRAAVAGVPVELTGTEFRLLEALLASAGELISLDQLSREALSRPHTPFDRSLGVHVSNLRKKLGPYADGSERIRNVRGEGYVFLFPDRSKERSAEGRP